MSRTERIGMGMLRLALAYLRRNRLNALLNVLLMAFGIGTITLLLLFSAQMEDHLYRNAEGIDAVVGAKGSPIQLILSGIYHMDSPTGNIPVAQARELMGQRRLIAAAHPLALGDSWRGYRIVGTTRSYLDLFSPVLDEGAYWRHPFEVVLGASVARATGAGVGDRLVSSHGLSEGGLAHPDHEMVVVGVLESGGHVLDHLVLSSVETMWGIHGAYDSGGGEEEGHGEGHGEDSDDGEGDEEGHGHEEEGHGHGEEEASERPSPATVDDSTWLGSAGEGREITVLLVEYANPLAAAQFPRYVNSRTSMQAAAPAFEINRLLRLLGIGLDSARVFGFILVFTSALGLFIALLNSMKERSYDLAVMRVMGGSRWRLVSLPLLEASALSLAGGMLGLALGHVGTHLLGLSLAQGGQQLSVSGFLFLPDELAILGLAWGVGLLSALLPAILAYRVPIFRTLSSG